METKPRIARPMGPGRYLVTLTPSHQTDPVILHAEPVSVLPVVFVPGIMGSNLRDLEQPPNSVWGLGASNLPFADPMPLNLAVSKFGESPGTRQRDLHPERTAVDNRGGTPSKPVGSIWNKEHFARRGWGEVGEASYHSFLWDLEEILNEHRAPVHDVKRVSDQFLALMRARPAGGERDAPWRPMKPFVSPTTKEIERMDDWLMPVYAFGYNWLQDNGEASIKLAERIKEIIAENQDGTLSFCKQVILVTHSMGGLVARGCAKLPGMEPLIAGVVHGVMPANGAAVAYRRCKVGMRDEDVKAAVVIGWTGRHTTAVFSQAPGALQLLPNQNYRTGWLEIQGPAGETLQQPLPIANPYAEIYGRRDRWWTLIREEWLAPEGGIPTTWEDYLDILNDAEVFHQRLGRNDYHPNTYAFYGADNEGKTHSFDASFGALRTLATQKRTTTAPS